MKLKYCLRRVLHLTVIDTDSLVEEPGRYCGWFCWYIRWAAGPEQYDCLAHSSVGCLSMKEEKIIVGVAAACSMVAIGAVLFVLPSLFQEINDIHTLVSFRLQFLTIFCR